MTPAEYGIPIYMAHGLRRYIEQGVLPGSFLVAVLCNDLKEAVSCADETNEHRLAAYVKYLHNETCSRCWGSPEKVAAWITHHEQSRSKAEGSEA